jgi:hypothetical protein
LLSCCKRYASSAALVEINEGLNVIEQWNSATRSPRTPPLARNDWRGIPATVEALRQFWMPIRFKPGA